MSRGLCVSSTRRNAIARAAASTSHHNHTAAIVGGVLGSLLGLALIAGIALVFLFRRRSTSTVPHNHVSPYTMDPESNVQPGLNALPQGRGLSEKCSLPTESQIVSQVPHSYSVSTVPQSQISAAEDDAEDDVAAPAVAPTNLPEAGASANAARPPSGAQPVLVDRIIELIAQRIDRRPDRTADDGSEAPPRYPESAV